MSATGYQIEWLLHRYAYDAAARSTESMLSWLSAHPQHAYRIYDLGAGLGSNVRFWSARIAAEQAWTMVEIDPMLIRAGNEILQEIPSTVSVHYVEADMMDYLAEQAPPDVLMCNALLDVLNAGQLGSLLDYLWVHRVPLLASINYAGMEFHPALADDAFFIQAYEAHMERKQPSGYALGRSLRAFLETVQGPYKVDFQPSTWEVPATDAKMVGFLLEFMAQALPEVLSKEDRSRLAAWLQERRAHLSQGILSTTVYHFDAWIERSEKKLG